MQLEPKCHKTGMLFCVDNDLLTTIYNTGDVIFSCPCVCFADQVLCVVAHALELARFTFACAVRLCLTLDERILLNYPRYARASGGETAVEDAVRPGLLFWELARMRLREQMRQKGQSSLQKALSDLLRMKRAEDAVGDEGFGEDGKVRPAPAPNKQKAERAPRLGLAPDSCQNRV